MKPFGIWVSRWGAIVLLLAIVQRVTGYIYFNEVFRFRDFEENCTLEQHLPCKATLYNDDCPLDVRIPEQGWPGAPVATQISFTPEVKSNQSMECMARLHVMWSIPNDNSALSVKGFKLGILPMSGDTVGMRMCVQYDLSGANWTQQDIKQKVMYSFSGVLLKSGRYAVLLNSLPQPAMGQNDNNIETIIDIPHIYQNGNGTCVVPSTSTTTLTTTPSTPAVQAEVESIDNGSAWSDKTKLWTGVGVGVGVGVVLVILLIVIVCRPSARRHAGDDVVRPTSSGGVGPVDPDIEPLISDDDVDPDKNWGRPPSVIMSSDYQCSAVQPRPNQVILDWWDRHSQMEVQHQAPIGQPVGPCMARPDRHAFIPPVRPEDIESNFSSQVFQNNCGGHHRLHLAQH